MSAGPSKYEVAFVEEQLPPPVTRITRIVGRLSKLPVELVEPIIQDLPLFRVLELLSAPGCGPSLVWAVEHSPIWSFLFQDHVSRLKRIWVSLNRLSWLWCSTHYMRVKDLPQDDLLRTAQQLRKRYAVFDHRRLTGAGEQIRISLEFCVRKGLRRLLGCDLYNVRPVHGARVYFGFSISDVRALGLFIPRGILVAILTRNFRALERALREAKLPRNSVECLADNEDIGKKYDLSIGDLTRSDLWTIEVAHRFLPFLARANKLLRESYSAELLSTAELYEQFPGKLKPPFAPRTTPGKAKHIVEALRKDAKRVLTTPVRTYEKVCIRPYFGKASSEGGFYERNFLRKPGFYRFRYPDTALIPSDWCFVLFARILRQYPLPDFVSTYPEALLPALREAQDGIHMIYHRNPGRYTVLLQRVHDDGMPDTERLEAMLDKKDLLPFLHHVGGPPKPLKELSWLWSFLTCVEWMEKAFHQLASVCRVLDQGSPRVDIRDLPTDALFPPADYNKFVAEAPAHAIASCIVRDSELCDTEDTTRPTELGLYLPNFSSPRGREIASYLIPTENVGLDIQQLEYDSLKEKITRYLQQSPKPKGNDDGDSTVQKN